MKATLPNGTTIEGTPEELARFIDKPSPFVQLPALTGLPYHTSGYLQVIPCDHDFPSPWLGVMPPSCRKCGASAHPHTVIVSTSTDSTNEMPQNLPTYLDGTMPTLGTAYASPGQVHPALDAAGKPIRIDLQGSSFPTTTLLSGETDVKKVRKYNHPYECGAWCSCPVAPSDITSMSTQALGAEGPGTANAAEHPLHFHRDCPAHKYGGGCPRCIPTALRP